MLFIFLHCVACGDFAVVNLHQDWVPPFWYVTYLENDLYTTTIMRQYYICFYYAMLIFGGGSEIGGTYSLEFLYVASCMLFSCIVNAIIFGEMAVLIEAIGRSETEFQNRIDTANTAMANLGIPTQLQEEIREFFIFNQGTLEQQTEMKKFFEMISSSLKIEVSQELFYNVAADNLIIKSVVGATIAEYQKSLSPEKGSSLDATLAKKEKEIIQSIIKYLTVELRNPEDIVIEQNNRTREMYFIAKGICTVQVVDQTKKLNK